MSINLKTKSIAPSAVTSGGVFIKRIPKDRLTLHLDAGDIDSYPGSGTTWYDLSGNGNNFSILSTAYNSSGVKYMDFNGSYGCAKKTDSDLSMSGDVTCICWTRILNYSNKSDFPIFFYSSSFSC